MLFADDIDVHFAPEEWVVFDRPVIGEGGAQGLLRDLHATQVRPGQIRVSYVLLDRAYAYAYTYGSGGFQDRFRMVIKAALRTGVWTPDGIIAKPPRQEISAGAFGRRR